MWAPYHAGEEGYFRLLEEDWKGGFHSKKCDTEERSPSKTDFSENQEREQVK